MRVIIQWILLRSCTVKIYMKHFWILRIFTYINIGLDYVLIHNLCERLCIYIGLDFTVGKAKPWLDCYGFWLLNLTSWTLVGPSLHNSDLQFGHFLQESQTKRQKNWHMDWPLSFPPWLSYYRKASARPLSHVGPTCFNTLSIKH